MFHPLRHCTGRIPRGMRGLEFGVIHPQRYCTGRIPRGMRGVEFSVFHPLWHCTGRIPRGMRRLEFLPFGQTYSARRSILRRIGEGIYFFRYFRTENKLPNRPMPAPMGRSRRQSCLSTVRKGRVRMVISVKISPALVPK